MRLRERKVPKPRERLVALRVELILGDDNENRSGSDDANDKLWKKGEDTDDEESMPEEGEEEDSEESMSEEEESMSEEEESMSEGEESD
jgi:hypothetical protein